MNEPSLFWLAVNWKKEIIQMTYLRTISEEVVSPHFHRYVCGLHIIAKNSHSPALWELACTFPNAGRSFNNGYPRKEKKLHFEHWQNKIYINLGNCVKSTSFPTQWWTGDAHLALQLYTDRVGMKECIKTWLIVQVFCDADCLHQSPLFLSAQECAWKDNLQRHLQGSLNIHPSP